MKAMVDVNYSHAMAPGAPIRVLYRRSDAFKFAAPRRESPQAVTDNACAAITVSFFVLRGVEKFFSKLKNSRFCAGRDTRTGGIRGDRRCWVSWAQS